MNAPGRLFLAPVSLGPVPWQGWLPDEARRLIAGIRHFVVENEKTARAQLKRLEHPGPLCALNLRALPVPALPAQLDALLAPALAGEDLALMSDAGCPAVADPGATLVERAHGLGIRVCPLVGPSSLLLALMGSGLNGQSFAFHGYLPVEESACQARLRRLEAESRKDRRTQLFIETPYRNVRLFERLCQCLAPETRLCIAVDLTTPDEFIHTRPVRAWRDHAPPSLSKRPALFLLLA